MASHALTVPWDSGSPLSNTLIDRYRLAISDLMVATLSLTV